MPGNNHTFWGLWVRWAALLMGISISSFTHAKLEDVEANQAKSREAYIDHFTKFTQDKNVMGKPTKPDGTSVAPTVKRKANDDDDNPFEGDLTYHDFSYDVVDTQYLEQQKKEAAEAKASGKDSPGSKFRQLYAGISGHGAISASGGSSLLERTLYALHDKFSEMETDKEKLEKDKKEGIQYRGVLKQETKEVFKDEQGNPTGTPPAAGSNVDTRPDKVERLYVREEATPEVVNVGAQSFDTFDRVAKGEGREDDPAALGTISLYYEAANRALKALWNSTLANLGQRRAERTVEPGADVGRAELNEEAATSDKWAQEQIAKIDPQIQGQEREQKLKEIQRMKKEADKILATSYKRINPELQKPEKPQGGGGAAQASGDQEKEVKDGDLMREDPRERDWRMALELQNKVGTKLQDLPSNWQYSDQDERGKVTTKYDEKGNPAGTEMLRMDEQVAIHNESLENAAVGMEDVKKRFPDLQGTAEDVRANKIPLNQLSATDITKYRSKSAYEGYEVVAPEGKNGEGGETEKPLPDNYLDLVNKK